MVDVSEIRNKEKTAKYVEKYLRKGLQNRKVLEFLGYARRWSCSRNWPRGHKLRLRGSADNRWTRVRRFVNSDVLSRRPLVVSLLADTEKSDCETLEQVGTDLALELFDKARVSRMRRMVQNANS